MSDSEDDKPLAARSIAVKQSSGLPKSVSNAAHEKANPSAAPQDPIKRKAAQKAPVIDESDSDEDKPLSARGPLAAKPGSAGAIKRSTSNAGGSKDQPKSKSIIVKKEAAVKDEPLSPKIEIATSPQKDTKDKKPRAKKGEGEKRVIVKKEYEKPGQTRETPSEIDPLRRFYSTLREQRPDSLMAKKWCVIHGILDDEDAEKIAAELKLKKGQLRSPGKPSPQKRKAAAPAATRPSASQARKAASKPMFNLEDTDDESFDDEDFTAPAKKVQKQGSGTTASTSNKPRAAAKPPTGAAAKESSGAAVPAQPAKARPGSGGSRPSCAEGGKPSSAGASRPASAQASKAPGPNRPGSGSSRKGAGDKLAVKSRPLIASTTKDKAFADGGLDPISDDSDDELPLAQRRLKA